IPVGDVQQEFATRLERFRSLLEQREVLFFSRKLAHGAAHTHHGVEYSLEGKLTHIAAHELGRLVLGARVLLRQAQEVAIQIEADDSHSLPGQWDAMATIAARDVEYELSGRQPQEAHRALRLPGAGGYLVGEQRQVVRPIDAAFLIPIDFGPFTHSRQSFAKPRASAGKIRDRYAHFILR